MTAELAGFGIPAFLPLATRKALQADEIREAREARDAEREREQQAEARRSADLAMFKDQAEARGEHVSALALATGQVAGRTVAEIVTEAAARADIEDARAEARQRRADGERLNLCFPEVPVARSQPRSAEGREIASLLRHYSELHADASVIERAQFASAARKALRRDRPVIPSLRDAARTASGLGWPA
jgi:hypothetical protein